jgi:iron(III) transport system ATP-binding protein
MKGLHLYGVSHAFGKKQVLHNVSLTIPAGEIVCLLGPSGSGKTTLLRLAAGLEKVQEGQIIIDECVVGGLGVHVPPERRRIGLVFQDYALFPHLTILDNVTFGLIQQSSKAARERAMEMLAQVGMTEYADKHPHTLSGGQQQRVALARALAPSPCLALLDEPFSGLDASLRIQIREETLSVLKHSGVATLMVTHDAEEAMFMADRIKILGSNGQVLQQGSPADIYYRPAAPFVANLFGPMNRIEGIVHNGAVQSPLGAIAVDSVDDGQCVEVFIRPEGLRLSAANGHQEGVPVEALSAQLLGHSTIVRLRVTNGAGRGAEFQVRVSGDFDPATANGICAQLDSRHAFVYTNGNSLVGADGRLGVPHKERVAKRSA